MHKLDIKKFSLIEILAFLTVISILLIITIPVITGFLINTKKKSYVSIVNEFVESTKKIVVNNETIIPNDSTPIYFSLDNINLKEISKSPFDNDYNPNSYIKVSYDQIKEQYIYSICIVDQKGNGIGEIESFPINISNVNVNSVQFGTAKCTQSKITNEEIFGNELDWEVSSKQNSSGGYTLLSFKGDLENCDNIKVSKNYYNKENSSLSYLSFFDVENIINTNAYTINIPNIINGKVITEIGEKLFFAYDSTNNSLIEPYMRIKKIIIPRGITKINGYSNNQIEYGPFMLNFNLSEVSLPSTLISIGNNVFMFTKLLSIDIPFSVEIIEFNSFKYATLNSVNFQGSIIDNSHLKKINKSAFENNNIISLSIPSSVETIGNYAFRNNNIKTLNFVGTSSDGSGNDTTELKTIGEEGFSHNNINPNLYLPNSLINIGVLAFGYSDCPGPVIYLNKTSVPKTFITSLDNYNNHWNSDWSCNDRYDVYILKKSGGYTKSIKSN